MKNEFQHIRNWATGGDKSNEELINIVQKFDEILRLENIRP